MPPQKHGQRSPPHHPHPPHVALGLPGAPLTVTPGRGALGPPGLASWTQPVSRGSGGGSGLGSPPQATQQNARSLGGGVGSPQITRSLMGQPAPGHTTEHPHPRGGGVVGSPGQATERLQPPSAPGRPVWLRASCAGPAIPLAGSHGFPLREGNDVNDNTRRLRKRPWRRDSLYSAASPPPAS